MFKRTLKKILPFSLWRRLRRLRYAFTGLEPEYKNKSNPDIFNDIYIKCLWGKGDDGLSTSGDGSHNENIIKPYVDVVKETLARLSPKKIIDIGCGDFNVGKNFAGNVDEYIACDVSSVILERNRTKYAHMSNVKFMSLNLASDEIPVGDVAFVRQVLQHLSNEDIKNFVDRINRVKPFRFLIVTEHLPALEFFKPNRDKPSGPNIRLAVDSGVVLHERPFNLVSKSRTLLLEADGGTLEDKSLIRTTLYEF